MNRSLSRPPPQNLARLLTPFALESRSVDAGAGTFSGWASTTSLDSWGTVLAPGAFRESLAEHAASGSMPALLAQHDWTQIVGRVTALSAREQAGVQGLWMDAAFELETQLGREYNALIQPRPRPALNGLSVGFEPDWDSIEWIDDVLVFHRADLWEISVVTFPANEAARIENARAGLEVKTERDLELTLRDAGRSRSEAKAIASRFRAKPPPRDAVGSTDAITLRALATEMRLAFSH